MTLHYITYLYGVKVKWEEIEKIIFEYLKAQHIEKMRKKWPDYKIEKDEDFEDYEDLKEELMWDHKELRKAIESFTNELPDDIIVDVLTHDIDEERHIVVGIKVAYLVIRSFDRKDYDKEMFLSFKNIEAAKKKWESMNVTYGTEPDLLQLQNDCNCCS